MSFANSYFLYFCLPPLGVFAYFILIKQLSYEKYFSPLVLDKILIKGDKLGKRGRDILVLFACFCFIIALARPISELQKLNIPQTNKNLIIAIDVSLSMKADDIYPNRLEFVKNRLLRLFDELSDTNIGIIAFTQNAFLVSPITSDKDSLAFLLSNLNFDVVSKQGTNIANALNQISKMFEKSNIKDVFLISDGGENSDIKKAIKIAKEKKLKVNIMVVGTQNGTSIKTKNGLLKDRQGNIVITKRNDNLIALSRESGGIYIKEFGGGNGVKLLTNSLKNIKVKSENITAQKEWFMLPLTLGFLCVLIAFHGLFRKNIALVLLFCFTIPSYGGILDFIHINKAEKYLQNKEYEKAINQYNKLNPNDEINYNKANAYYKQNKFKEALQEYEKVKSEDKNLKSKALFNSGNAHNALKQHEQALQNYEQALKLNPKDEDIKKNIKITKELIKKKKQNQQGDKKNQKNNDQKNSKKNQKNENKNSENKSDQNQSKASHDNNQTKQHSDLNQTKQPIQTQKQEDLEGKKWESYLRENAPKTKPIMLGKNKGEDSENNW